MQWTTTGDRITLPYVAPEDDLQSTPATIKALAEAVVAELELVEAGAIEGVIPVGTIQMWAMLTPPEGWLLCDGSVVNKALHPKLHELLEADGFLYGGDANGAMIPDLARRVPFGDTPGETGGLEQVTLTPDQMPSHDHAVTLHDGGHSHSAISTAGGGPNSNASWTVGGAAAGGASTFGWTGNNGANIRVKTDNKWDLSRNTGGGQAHENMPPYLTVNFIIKHD